MEYPEFYQLVTPRMKPLLPLKVEALRKTIVQPALASDVQLIFEGTLIGDLLFEVQGQTGALPLLQFALEQLFERRKGHRITLRAYRDIGGVKGALKLHAEKTYFALPSETHRKLARALFLRLIEPGNTEQETSRRRPFLTEFAFDDMQQTNLMQETIDTFVNARLLTVNGNEHTETVASESNQKALISTAAKTTTIEVSHEALITEWPLLNQWVSEARKDLPLQHAISEDAADWEQNNRPADRLYRGTQLKEAKAWATRNIASRQEQAFLRASATRRLRSIMTVIVGILLVVASSGIAGLLALQLPPDSRYVTNASDDGKGSLRWAIANTRTGDTITFDPRLAGKTIVLKSNDIHIFQQSLTLKGPGKDRLTIREIGAGVIVDKKAFVTISGLAFQGSNQANQPTLIRNEGTLTITNTTISGNSVSNGAGGIHNTGTLTVTNSIISGNTAPGGAGIYNGGTLIMNNSIISGNTATYDFFSGGGIQNDGILTVTNSTISGNTSSGAGGGIYNSGTLTVTNSTISGNTVSVGVDSTYHGGGPRFGGHGGGIYNEGFDNLHVDAKLIFCTIVNNSASGGEGLDITNSALNASMYMKGSIVGGNDAKHTHIAGVITSGGYNIIQQMSSVKIVSNTAHVTDRSIDDLTSVFGPSPMLQKNSGPTETYKLLSSTDNPATNAIPLEVCHVKDLFDKGTQKYTDQRGMPRPGGKKQRCDIGAYESSD